jgi:hypothetical protein
VSYVVPDDATPESGEIVSVTIQSATGGNFEILQANPAPAVTAIVDNDHGGDDSGDSDHENHGHGNNLDGEDDDNPGQGSGGPNDDKDGSDEDEGALGNHEDANPGSEENDKPGNDGGDSSGENENIDWGTLLDTEHGKNWVQTLELSPEAHDKLASGDWTLIVDGKTVDPDHLPGKLDDADVRIEDHHGQAIESIHGVDKIEWGDEHGH